MAGLLAYPNCRQPSRPDSDNYRDRTVAKFADNMKGLQLRVQLRISCLFEDKSCLTAGRSPDSLNHSGIKIGFNFYLNIKCDGFMPTLNESITSPLCENRKTIAS